MTDTHLDLTSCATCDCERRYLVDEDDLLCPDCGECGHSDGFPASDWLAEPDGAWIARYIGKVRDVMRIADLDMNEAGHPDTSVVAVRNCAVVAHVSLAHAANLLAAVQRRISSAS